MTLLENWWTLVVRGLFGILFGLLALFLPGATLLALVILFGAYALADGVVALLAGGSIAREHRRWWPLFVEGIAGIATGLVTFFWPGITAVALLVVIAVWALVTGVLELVAAVRLREQIAHEWLLALSGILSIAFGVVLIARPAAGALAMITVVGIYGLVFGGALIALGLRVRRAGARVSPPPAAFPRPI